MDKRTNYLSLILLDALEDENESDINFILDRNSKAIDPSYVPQDRGISPLHYVCGMRNKQLAINIAGRFLDMGADPNCRSEDNMTPLHVAAMYGREEIVSLLLKCGAELEVYDDDRKTPVLYAIDECNFEVIQIMKDHIFLKKYEKRKVNLSRTARESSFNSPLQKVYSNRKQLTTKESDDLKTAKNKNLLRVTNNLNDSLNNGNDGKFTPNRINYNYDVTSPYYINITHRRDKPQPIFPDLVQDDINPKSKPEGTSRPIDNILSFSPQEGNQCSPEPIEVNIFSLTTENIKELSLRNNLCERSRLSLIEIWREKVQKSRARKSIIKQFNSVGELVDQVIENDHLNFTNTELKDNSTIKVSKDSDRVSSSCTDTSDNMDDISGTMESDNRKIQKKSQMSLSKLMKTVAEAKIENFESNHLAVPERNIDLESSYQTVPEMSTTYSIDNKEIQNNKATHNFTRFPKNNEYFLQMTEAYVHTDDENGLVFYETKLLSNIGNIQNIENSHCATKNSGQDLQTSITSQSTNITLPLDYETDTLRAELTAFGEPPGPITKTTKKLYIKRLIKYKRKLTNMLQLPKNQNRIENTFSFELQNTLKSEEYFHRIKDYIKYETQSMEYFESNINKKQMREGHLKQSFIYMLIDPRISCNLPGESVFLKEFDVWTRFLKSIFYVGKGKTIRPYSHLYDAMKKHLRLHNKELLNKTDKNGKKISIKKQPLNIDIFKSPPQKTSDSKKLDRILNIWGNGNGVVCLHVFHNILPIDAYTREAAIIDALSLQHLTNCKRGDYYGPSKTWTMKEKKYLGIALLFKAMRMYLAEGESQLSPSDLI